MSAYECGHAERVSGCGGCDPNAVEYVLDDGATAWRPFNPALDWDHSRLGHRCSWCPPFDAEGGGNP